MSVVKLKICESRITPFRSMFLRFSRILANTAGTRSAVTLAKDELGRVPAVVFGDKPGDEAGKGVGVLVHPPEGLFRVLAGQPPEAGAGHVDKDQIAGVEQRVGVVNEFIGRCWQVLVATGNHVLGTQRTHVQPDGGAARSAVVEEGDGPILSLRVFLEVSDVKHTCNWGCVLWVFRVG